MPASWRPMLSVVTSVLWPAEVVRVGGPAFGKACPAMRTETPRAAIAPKLQTLFLFMARAPLLLIGFHEDIEGPDRLFPPLRQGLLVDLRNTRDQLRLVLRLGRLDVLDGLGVDDLDMEVGVVEGPADRVPAGGAVVADHERLGDLGHAGVERHVG